jgi:hypothetical protein
MTAPAQRRVPPAARALIRRPAVQAAGVLLGTVAAAFYAPYPWGVPAILAGPVAALWILLRAEWRKLSAAQASASPIPGEDVLRATVRGDDIAALTADALEQGAKLWGAGTHMETSPAREIATSIDRSRGAFRAWITVRRIGGDA